MNLPVLITGGLGFIGSHTAVVLAEAGVPIVILDNQSNSSPKVLERLAKLNVHPLEYVHADVRDTKALDTLFGRQQIGRAHV